MVLSSSDVWVFGQPYFPGPGLGAWNYNGRTFDGSDIAHWNGSTWSRTSVAYALPPRQELNDPMLQYGI